MIDDAPIGSYGTQIGSWVGIGWVIAALLGLWGAMIGIGKFGLSEFFFLVAGAIVAAKVAYEAWQLKTRKQILTSAIFILALAGVEFFTMRWTATLAAEAVEQQHRLAQLDQIPDLQKRLGRMTQDMSVQQAKAQQQLDDIRQDNTGLKASIEQKDAVLASIAKQQFALNFEPQIVVMNGESPKDVRIVNEGKTNIRVLDLFVNSSLQREDKFPAEVAHEAYTQVEVSPEGEQAIIARAEPYKAGADLRVTYDCWAIVQTADKKRYRVPFTWTFIVKDQAIKSSLVMTQPIIEIKSST